MKYTQWRVTNGGSSLNSIATGICQLLSPFRTATSMCWVDMSLLWQTLSAWIQTRVMSNHIGSWLRSGRRASKMTSSIGSVHALFHKLKYWSSVVRKTVSHRNPHTCSTPSWIRFLRLVTCQIKTPFTSAPSSARTVRCMPMVMRMTALTFTRFQIRLGPRRSLLTDDLFYLILMFTHPL